MPDGWSDLIKSLKLHHVLFVILGSATIWVAAHSFAEPGSTVKVLWGLVEYTKPSGAEATRIPNDRTAIYQTPPTATSIDPSEGRENHGDIELSQDQAILSTHAATEKIAKKATEDLRIKKALRPLSPLETGIPMSKSPPGTFFFAANFELTRDPEISARRSIFSSVEIHHRTQGKFVVVCYTTESDAERLRLSDRGKEAVVVFMEPWRNHITIVEIPLDRIDEAKSRTITTTDSGTIFGMDMVIDTVH